MTQKKYLELLEDYRRTGCVYTLDEALGYVTNLESEITELRNLLTGRSCKTCDHWKVDPLVTGEGTCLVFNHCITEHDFYCKDFDNDTE